MRPEAAVELLGRNLSRYLRRVPETPAFAWYLVKSLMLFRHPIRLLWAYLTMTLPSGGLIELRDGLRIHLSSHPHDAVNVFYIFAREEYGRIPPGSVVVDIGANIGIFSLYAARSEAARVLAYEPCLEAYRCLVRNLEVNSLEGVVRPHRQAVTGAGVDRVRFPKTSSPYNAILTAEDHDESEWVDTVDLASIVKEAGAVDVLKLDCEGREYEILFSAGPEVYQRIKEIRLEYHRGRVEEIRSFLESRGFLLRRARATSPPVGTLRFARAPQAARP
jgi:FkbM family methyltransferase